MLIKVFILLAAVVTPQFSYEIDPQYKEWVLEYSNEYGVDPLDVAAIITIESYWDELIINESSLATGLGQIMPREAGKQFEDRPTIEELKDPETNIKWTCLLYSKYLLESGGSSYRALFHYSGGPAWESKKRYTKMYWREFWRARRVLRENAKFRNASVQDTRGPVA